MDCKLLDGGRHPKQYVVSKDLRTNSDDYLLAVNGDWTDDGPCITAAVITAKPAISHEAPSVAAFATTPSGAVDRKNSRLFRKADVQA